MNHALVESKTHSLEHYPYLKNFVLYIIEGYYKVVLRRPRCS